MIGMRFEAIILLLVNEETKRPKEILTTIVINITKELKATIDHGIVSRSIPIRL
jgi:hypothetical protein